MSFFLQSHQLWSLWFSVVSAWQHSNTCHSVFFCGHALLMIHDLACAACLAVQIRIVLSFHKNSLPLVLRCHGSWSLLSSTLHFCVWTTTPHAFILPSSSLNTCQLGSAMPRSFISRNIGPTSRRTSCLCSCFRGRPCLPCSPCVPHSPSVTRSAA